LSFLPPPVAKVFAFQGHQLIALTAPLCPFKLANGAQALMSKMQTLLSFAPEANTLNWSGLTLMEQISPL
jgi:hypothetical protein